MRNATGFTLIEMVTTLVILGILGAMGAHFLTAGTRAYVDGRDLAEQVWQGQVALERITRELRRARSASAADLFMTAGQLSFRDIDGNNVCFYVSGNQLMRSADFTGGACATQSQVLATNTSALGVTYLRSDGVTAAGTQTQVSLVTVQLTPVQGTAVRGTVHPRLFP